MNLKKRVVAAEVAVAAAVAVAAVATVALSHHGRRGRTAARGVPICASGQIANYLNQSGPGASDQFTDLATTTAPRGVTAQSAFDAADAGTKASGADFATDPSTKGRYCAAFGLLTDTTVHVPGGGSTLQYVNKPMWAVYVGGLHLPSSSNGVGHGDSAEHTAQVWFVDPASGQVAFATTVA